MGPEENPESRQARPWIWLVAALLCASGSVTFLLNSPGGRIRLQDPDAQIRQWSETAAYLVLLLTELISIVGLASLLIAAFLDDRFDRLRLPSTGWVWVLVILYSSPWLMLFCRWASAFRQPNP